MITLLTSGQKFRTHHTNKISEIKYMSLVLVKSKFRLFLQVVSRDSVSLQLQKLKTVGPDSSLLS